MLESGRKYNCPTLESIFVTAEESIAASESFTETDALQQAADRIREFHEVQLGVITHDWEELAYGWGWRTGVTGNEDTGFEGQRMTPIQSVGIYVPGGKANYPSSVLMNVIPAQVAGVERIVVATPAGPDGNVSDGVLAACRMLGVGTILKAGGAAAIGAFAYGIEGMPRVDMIAGPGSVYVNEAKRQVWGTVGLDGFAGPSEVALVIDNSTDPVWAAADLFSQVEHAPDNVAFVVALTQTAAADLVNAMRNRIEEEPRAEIIRESLDKHSCILVVNSDEEAAEAINRFAPEHVSILCQNAGWFAEKIVNAGCVLVGPYSAQSAGDYCSGPSHTLPTAGAARFASPVSVTTFMKTSSVSMLSQSDITELAPIIEALATVEGFPAHARGATIRVEE